MIEQGPSLFNLRLFSFAYSPDYFLSAIPYHRHARNEMIAKCLNAISNPGIFETVLMTYPEYGEELMRLLAQDLKKVYNLFKDIPGLLDFIASIGSNQGLGFEPLQKKQLLKLLFDAGHSNPAWIASYYKYRQAAHNASQRYPELGHWWLHFLMYESGYIGTLCYCHEYIEELLCLFPDHHADVLSPFLDSKKKLTCLIRKFKQITMLQKVTSYPSPILKATSLKEVFIEQNKIIDRRHLQYASRLVAQARRDPNALLGRLPDDILIKIIMLCDPLQSLDEVEKRTWSTVCFETYLNHPCQAAMP